MTRLLIFLLPVLACCVSCNKLEVLTEEVNLILDTDILANPVTLQFIDANPNNLELPFDIKIKTIGPDADKVFSVLGQKDIKTDGNIVTLAFRKSAVATMANPLEFSIIVNAPGYLETIYPLIIESLDRIRFETVSLIRPDSPPRGISASTANFIANKSGTLQDYTFETGLENGKREKVILNIPKKTKFFGEDGKALQGTAQVVLVHYDNRRMSSLISSPGGFMLNNAKDLEGNNLGKGAFVSAGILSLEMYVNKERVRSSSRSISITMDINEDMINPSTGQNIQSGDTIPVWRLSENTGEWQMATSSLVEKENGGLIATASIDHFAHLNWDWWREWCRSSIKVNTSIPIEKAGKNYLVVLFRSYRWDRYYWEWPVEWRHFRLYDGEELDFKAFSFEDQNRAYKLRVYENIYDLHERLPIVESDFFYLACNAMTIDFSDILAPSEAFVQATVQVSATCSDRLEIRPTANLYFRETDSPYQYYPFYTRLESGQGITSSLKKGASYNFYFAFGPIQRYLENITIPSDSQQITITNRVTGSKDILEFEYTDEDQLVFRYLNIQLSEENCDDLSALGG